MGAARGPRKLQRRTIVQGAVRALLIVVHAPPFDQHPGLVQHGEPVFVETFIPHLPVETLHVGVLHRLAGLDELLLHAALVGPAIQRPTGEFRAVVGYYPFGQAPPSADLIEHARHALPGQRGIHLDGQTLAGEVIDHRQQPKPSPVGQLIADEIQRPALVGPLGRCRFLSPPPGRPLSFAYAHLQVFLLVDAKDAFVVIAPTFAAQQYPQPSIPEASPLGRTLPQPLPQRLVAGRLGHIVITASGELHQPARPSLAHRVVLPHGGNRLAFGGGRQYFPALTSLRIWMSSAWSATARPASASFRIAMICSSRNRFPFILAPSWLSPDYPPRLTLEMVQFQGSRSIGRRRSGFPYRQEFVL